MPLHGYAIATDAFEAWRRRLLGAFVLVPDEFISIMDLTGAILVGSALLAAIEPFPRTPWLPPRYDFFIPSCTYNTFLAYFFNRMEGIVVKRRFRDNATLMEGIAEVTVISSLFSEFVLYSTESTCPMLPLARSCSSHLFNFMSSRALCIGYPKALITRTATAHPHPANPVASENEALIREYTGTRKYVLGTHASSRTVAEEEWSATSDHIGDGLCARAIRHFGDGDCLTVYFNEPPPPSEYLVQHSYTRGEVSRRTSTVKWVFGGEPCGTTHCRETVQPSAESTLLCQLPRLL